MKNKLLMDVLDYEQPTKYIVKNTNYKSEYDVPVLTAGKSFILGYTNDTDGIYHASKENPVIIFDDFTTECRYIDFDFKVKSSAIKFLKPKEGDNLKYLLYVLKNIVYDTSSHKRYWISQYSQMDVQLHEIDEQNKIVKKIEEIESSILLKNKQNELLITLINSKYNTMITESKEKNILGDFISPYTAKKCKGRELPILSITKDYGIVMQSEKFKKRIASVNTDNYKIVPKGKLVQGIHIDERNFAIQNIVDEGIVSPAYKTWNVDTEKAIPEIIEYALRTDETMDYIRSKFSGSIKRREKIDNKDFLNIKLNLPDKEQQQNFLDYKKKVNELLELNEKSGEKLNELLECLMQEYFRRFE